MAVNSEIGAMDIDPRRSLSQQEFCWLEISKAKFYELKKRGLTPDEIDIDGVLRITPKAREEWHARMVEHAKGEAAQLEAERRRELAVSAGRAAAQSPLHVSKQKQQKPQPRGRAGRFSEPRDIERRSRSGVRKPWTP
jgi:hypothetical protein